MIATTTKGATQNNATTKAASTLHDDSMPNSPPRRENCSRLGLPQADQETLKTIKVRRDIVLSQIRAVIDGDTTAFLLWGSGGHGKSHLIREGVKANDDRARWHSGDMSPKGLFNQLKEFPDQVHIFEDMEKLYKDVVGQALLRAACGGPRDHQRWVGWGKDGNAGETPFVFNGGVILLTNENPTGSSMIMKAIASRFAPQQWHLSDPELAATMPQLPSAARVSWVLWWKSDWRSQSS